MRPFIVLLIFLLCSNVVCAAPAQEKCDSLLKIWYNKTAADTVRIKAIKQVAWEHYAFVNTDSAAMYAKLGYELAKQKSNKKYMSVMLNTLGSIYALRGDFADAITKYNEALIIQKSLNDYYGISKTYNNLGYTFRNQGKFEEALQYQLKSLSMQEKYGYTDFKLATLVNIGITYQEFNNYQLALKFYIKALKIAEQMNDEIQVADIQNNMGLLFINQKEYSKALKNYYKNVEIFSKAGNIIGLAPSYLNIGLCYEHMNILDSSLSNYTKAIHCFEKVGDKPGIGKTFNNIGVVYIKKQNYDEALLYFKKSLEMNRLVDSKKDMATTLGNIGFIYQQKKQFNEAKKYLEESLLQAKASGSIAEISNSAAYLWSLYKTTHQYQKALQMHELYSLMKDSISSDEKQKELLKATIKFGYEKKAAADSVANAKQLEIKNVELNNQRIQIKAKRNEQIALFAGLTLVLIFSGFLYNRYKLTQQQKIIIETAHQSLEIKSKEILDSITYSKRIQKAILPPERIVNSYFHESFILYIPKDIVAGDFYWMEKIEDRIYVAVCDCTGHGVPGALVSVVCNNALNRAVNEFGEREPGKIFDKTRTLILENFAKSDEDVKDGMDASLAVLDFKSNSNSNHVQNPNNNNTVKLKWAGANNPLWVVKNRGGVPELTEIKPDKQPIGKGFEDKSFSTHELDLQKGDTLYLFTDGYADQFGGNEKINGKKITKARFREQLLSISGMSMEEQHRHLLNYYETYKGKFEQVDDVCVIGIRV